MPNDLADILPPQTAPGSQSTPASATLPASHWSHSLKARIVAGALAAVLVGIALSIWHMSRVAEANLIALEETRSHEEVQRIAAVVGHRVGELQRALRLAAGQLRRDSLAHPHQLSDHMRHQHVLRGLFGSLGIADGDGRLFLVIEATGAQKTAVSVADRDYFRRAFESGLPAVSAPIASRITQEPVVVLAHPLVDEAGAWGVLTGTLQLNARDLIGDLVETRNNDDGTLIVITDDEGRILAHPQRARILRTLDDEPRLADVVGQWRDDRRPLQRDAGRWTSPADVVAMAGEPATGWHVWRATSREDLLAPLRAARVAAVMVAGAFALLISALLLLLLVQVLQPLSEVQQRALALLNGDDSGKWPSAGGEIGTLIHTLRHVWAERLQAEHSNAQVLQKLSSVMAASPVGLAFSRSQRFELVSSECCRLLGCREQDLIGNPMAMIFAAGTDYAVLRSEARAAFDKGQAYEGEWKLRAADGRDFWARIRARPVVEGRTESGSIWSLYDIDTQVAARETLQREALNDGLTGVLNRKGFERELEAAWQRRSPEHPASVLMIDLDHFKPVNDRGGHAAGDAMLKAVAATLSRQVRSSDIVARLGGDEFAVLMPGCHAARAVEIAETIRQGIRDIKLAWGGHAFRIGASLGVAELLPTQASAAVWLAAADAACYEAKASGRDTIRDATRPAVRLVASQE